jgi:hypothetical protein|tara:strand:+ start:919 stop:1161 length:243 start_codon:yes stop_codon:yes gene_type:complete
MGLIDEIMEGDLFTHYADQLGDDEREFLEKSVREMLSTADSLHAVLKSQLADQKGRSEVSDALEYLISEEGQKTWRQDKS